MKKFKEVFESKKTIHPLAVHYSYEGGKNIVKHLGSKAQKHLNIGDHLKSSDIDDLIDAKFKVKQI